MALAQQQKQDCAAEDLEASHKALQLVASKPALPSLMRASHLAPKSASRLALPALKAPQALTEVMIEGARDGAASAFAAAMALGLPETIHHAMAQAAKTLTVWVLDSMSRLEAGLPYPHGVSGSAEHLALVKARDAAELLWAMEEALLSGAAKAVIGEVWGMPKALNFTATKRLQRAAQLGKTPAILLRYGAAEEGMRPASGAHERWVVTSQPSAGHRDDPAAPGPPGWFLDRFKTRLSTPSSWTCFYDHDQHALTDTSGAPASPSAPSVPTTNDQQSDKGAQAADRVHMAAPLAHGTVSSR